MTQLTDDCFAFSGPLMPLAEMEKLIVERIAPVAETERVALAKAGGRIAAADIVAPLPLPPFDNSAVDGYAVRHADLKPDGDTRLKISGRLTAGRSANATIGAGEAIRIFTGAPMPPGADTVFMQEDTEVDGEMVVLPSGLKKGANRRLAGEDTRKGEVVIAAGTRFAARHVALAAALGLTELDVRRKLRVAVFSTGDEVVEPGGMLGKAGIYDANRFLLAQLLGQFGAEVTDLGILRDEPEVLSHAIQKAAADHDLVLTSGGVSTGEADHVRDAVERVGRLVFWRVGIKPGRPVAMGVIRNGENSAAFAGLPGNPVAVFVTFVRVVRPLLMRLSGAALQPIIAVPVRAAFAYRKKKGRREYVRVSLRKAADGELEAVKFPQDGAGVLTSLTATDGLLEFPEDVTEIEAGARVGFLSYAVLAS
ncbi:MAG: gephyrin-like molybdotransferase Glp [Xanthobacteraceae bacterium]|uniref:molybdopterin molybdotransferase MoeA n=1 Tax=Pseudolabrys sp. TaxID=1960880 RepID=UPI003D0A0A8F